MTRLNVITPIHCVSYYVRIRDDSATRIEDDLCRSESETKIAIALYYVIIHVQSLYVADECEKAIPPVGLMGEGGGRFSRYRRD